MTTTFILSRLVLFLVLANRDAVMIFRAVCLRRGYPGAFHKTPLSNTAQKCKHEEDHHGKPGKLNGSNRRVPHARWIGMDFTWPLVFLFEAGFAMLTAFPE